MSSVTQTDLSQGSSVCVSKQCAQDEHWSWASSLFRMAARGKKRVVVLQRHLRGADYRYEVLQDLPCCSGRVSSSHFKEHEDTLIPSLDSVQLSASGMNQSQESSRSRPAAGSQIALQACYGSAYKVSDPVKRALEAGRPVVALESTIVCHGMPFPQNLKTAREVEDIVRANGAEPATIAIMRGVVHVGLSDADLEDLARRGLSVKKTARRDIAHVVSQKKDGATTVSATMFFAAKVGIPVFVTGGIGGVHRGAESSMDVSSDLTELGRTPVAVVCAGVKSILDIPRTLEYLETQGVTVAALGSDEFPAFFTPDSGCKAPSRVDSETECAELIDANLRLGLGSGIVIGVPIPDSDAAASERVEAAIQRALAEASGIISGADSTPFLLKRVNELTGGASLQANIALVKNNAKVGAKIARHLATIRGAKTMQRGRL